MVSVYLFRRTLRNRMVPTCWPFSMRSKHGGMRRLRLIRKTSRSSRSSIRSSGFRRRFKIDHGDRRGRVVKCQRGSAVSGASKIEAGTSLTTPWSSNAYGTPRLTSSGPGQIRMARRMRNSERHSIRSGAASPTAAIAKLSIQAIVTRAPRLSQSAKRSLVVPHLQTAYNAGMESTHRSDAVGEGA